MDARANSPLRAIRKFCLQCVETEEDVKACTANELDIKQMAGPESEGDYVVCPLWPFRLGHGLGKRNPGLGNRGFFQRDHSPGIHGR